MQSDRVRVSRVARSAGRRNGAGPASRDLSNIDGRRRVGQQLVIRPGRAGRVDLRVAPVGENVIAYHDRESETRALHPRGYAAISLPQAPSVRLPSLGGLIGWRIVAGRALLLTTTGRRSGQPRTRALIYAKMATGWWW